MTEKPTIGRSLAAFAVFAVLLGGQPAAGADATTDLFAAVARGDAVAAKGAVERGADLAARNQDGVTPLALALNLGRLDIARLLSSAAQQVRAGAGASPFDVGYVPAGAYHPVQITPEAVQAAQAEAARAAQAEAARVPMAAAPPAPAPSQAAAEASVTPPAAAATTAPQPQPPAPATAVAKADASPSLPQEAAAPEQPGQDNAAVRFFRNLFGGGSEPPPAEAPAPSETQALASLPQGTEASPVQQPNHSKREAVFLDNVTLSLGEELRLGAERALPSDPNATPPAGCILKRQAHIGFCIESTVWNDGIDKEVSVSSVIYRGTKAVVRYDQGVATYAHSLIPSSAFTAVSEYYRAKFGPPTDTWVLPVRRPDLPVGENAVHVWQSKMADGSVAILEVRQYDEARTGFVDRRHGAVILRDSRNLQVFTVVSQFEVMLLKTPDQ